MKEFLRKVFCPAPAVPSQREQLAHQLRQVRQRMDQVQSLFDSTCDRELTECFIHELSALDAQYRFLLRLAREDAPEQCPAGAERM